VIPPRRITERFRRGDRTLQSQVVDGVDGRLPFESGTRRDLIDRESVPSASASASNSRCCLFAMR